MNVEVEYAQNLVLRVRDNGVGMAPAVIEQGKPGHFGLQGMRERAGRIDARLSEASGTTVSLVVPGGIAFRPRAADATVSSLENEFSNVFSAQNFSVFIPGHSGLVLTFGVTDYFLCDFFFLDASI